MLNAAEVYASFSEHFRLSEHEARQLASAYLQLRPETRNWKVRVSAMDSMNPESCNYNIKTIFLEKHLIRYGTPEKVRDEILQMMAHAIVGRWDFSPQWVETALELGAARRSVTRRVLAAAQS